MARRPPPPVPRAPAPDAADRADRAAAQRRADTAAFRAQALPSPARPQPAPAPRGPFAQRAVVPPTTAAPATTGRTGRTRSVLRPSRWRRTTRDVRRRMPGRRALGAVTVVLLVLAAAAAVLLATPVTAVQRVVVTGAHRTDPAAVRAAAAGQVGRPLLRVDAGAVRRRTRDLPFVDAVTLQRRFPHELVVRVVEKVPVAAVPHGGASADPGGPVDLLDADGDVITTAATAPDGVPVVGVDVAAVGTGVLRAASAVALDLPADLRAQVAGITASSADDVRLTLRSGALVRWGSAEDSALKAQVLTALEQRKADGYDVSAPGTPATW